MEVATEAIRRLTGEPCRTADETKRAARAAILRVHPDKLARDLDPEQVRQATGIFGELKAHLDTISSGCRAGGDSNGTALLVPVPLQTFQTGGGVNVVLSTGLGWSEICVPVIPGVLPPHTLTVEGPRGLFDVTLVDDVGTGGDGEYAPRRRPNTLDIEVKCQVLTDSDLVSGFSFTAVTSLLRDGQVVVEMPPYCVLCNNLTRPYVVFQDAGINDGHGSVGDLWVYPVPEPQVGLSVESCAFLERAGSVAKEAQGECDELRQQLHDANTRLRFFSEMFESPPLRRSRRRIHSAAAEG